MVSVSFYTFPTHGVGSSPFLPNDLDPRAGRKVEETQALCGNWQHTSLALKFEPKYKVD